MSVDVEGHENTDEYELREWQFDSDIFEFGSNSYQNDFANHKPEELHKELQEYKQSLWSLRKENSLLKVKVSRLEETLKKKNNIIDLHYQTANHKLNPKESLGQLSHKLDNLEEQNDSLKETLSEKEKVIRQLQKKINTLSAYKPKSKTRKPNSLAPSRLTERSQDFTYSIQESDRSLLQSDTNTLRDSELMEPHKEIEILHTGFKDILNEVTKLKASVADLNEARAKPMRVFPKHVRKELETIPSENDGWSTSLRIKNEGDKKSSIRFMAGEKSSKTGSRNVASAFARIQPVVKTTKGQRKSYKDKKINPLAIRTGSETSLRDEADLTLYIEEVLKDMNREVM